MWVSGKESACQCRRHRRHGLDFCIGKIPWRREWQPTAVFLPRKSHRGAWWATVHRVTEESDSTYQLNKSNSTYTAHIYTRIY